jgi:hypothetical protein
VSSSSSAAAAAGDEPAVDELVGSRSTVAYNVGQLSANVQLVIA